MNDCAKKIVNTIEAVKNWNAPEISEEITYGDMPGDKVEIGVGHIEKANKIFPTLLHLIKEVAYTNDSKVVISVCGGSGVGKSETASLLSYYLRSIGLNSYTLSGDNYPRRIPLYNDAERLKVFREQGLLRMIRDGVYTEDRFHIIQKFQENGTDANKDNEKEYSWYHSYIEGGRFGLESYLGTPNEINFNQLSEIINNFKQGADQIHLKRMGRTDTQLWFEKVDFSEISILVIEWTHGNNDHLIGVDIPILLNSTPEETLAHRRSRNRDGEVDSPFVTTVLEVEQNLLASQAKKAKIILSKGGDMLSYEEYLNQ